MHIMYIYTFIQKNFIM